MLFDDTASISILPFPRRAPTVNALINRKMMDGHYCAPETISVPFDSPRIPPASFDAHLTKFKFLCRRSCSNQVEICEFAIQLEGYPLWDNYAATMEKKIFTGSFLFEKIEFGNSSFFLFSKINRSWNCGITFFECTFTLEKIHSKVENIFSPVHVHSIDLAVRSSYE